MLSGLVAFSIAYIMIHSLKPALKPCEPIWGPVFIGLTVLALGMGLAERIPQTLAIASKEPGKSIELVAREPTFGAETIRKKRLADLVRKGQGASVI